ncbi:uncharacterized protein DMENIID0001_074590 [Sergentomyia squamirostris]
MARLVSYKVHDENRYSTFGADFNGISNSENTSSRFQLVQNRRRRRKVIRTKGVFSWRLWVFCQCLCCVKIRKKLCPCQRIRWCHLCSSESDDDASIDRYVNQYKYEMSIKDGKVDTSAAKSSTDKSPSQQSTLRADEVRKGKKHFWHWNDSLKSNSDKFLESLEYDAMQGNSLKKYTKIPKIRFSTHDENPVSPEVAPISPVNASKNVTSGGPTSPAGSRGSASSDPWPSQSDEDIDRLVALHQNRHSLSSLGLRSDSMASVYSGAGEGRYGTVVVKGNIEFGMQYNYKQNALEIHIVQCKELAAVDTKRNRSDPYVKVYLLPDKSKSGKRKTKVKKHTLNPFFDEVLKFHMSISSLESRTLWLTVWHSDMFGRNDFLGEVLINLQGKLFDNPQPQWYQLQERSEPFDEPAAYRGDIIVGLKFVPPDSGYNSGSGNLSLRKFSKSSIKTTTKGSLHVLVKEAKNLMPVKANGTCDAFCKSYLLPEKSRSTKRKTDVIKRTVNPVWNHTIVYEDVTLQELSERALELTIWDHDRLASNEFLGGVRFSLGSGKHYGKSVEWMDATGKELSLWQSMLNRPNFWVEGCLVLRSSIDTARNSL